MKHVVIVGATSAIAEATARIYAQQGAKLTLLARNLEKAEAIAADLKVRGASETAVMAFDATDTSNYVELADQLFQDKVDVVLIAHGSLPDQEKAQLNPAYAKQELRVNGLATVALMEQIASHLEQQQSGTMAVISSVAGDRGRQSNYLYGAAKALVTTYASGLRNRLTKSGAHVVTVKPGFVDTPMTSEFPKGPLWAKPEKVASDIVNAIEKGRNEIYTPWFWWGIMMIIRNIPEFLFKKLSL